jgi:hypothetical protein
MAARDLNKIKDNILEALLAKKAFEGHGLHHLLTNKQQSCHCKNFIF